MFCVHGSFFGIMIGAFLNQSNGLGNDGFCNVMKTIADPGFVSDYLSLPRLFMLPRWAFKGLLETFWQKWINVKLILPQNWGKNHWTLYLFVQYYVFLFSWCYLFFMEYRISLSWNNALHWLTVELMYSFHCTCKPSWQKNERQSSHLSFRFQILHYVIVVAIMNVELLFICIDRRELKVTKTMRAWPLSLVYICSWVVPLLPSFLCVFSSLVSTR